MNWREIEAELVDIAKHDLLEVTEMDSGDMGLIFTDDNQVDLNLTLWAKALADRLNARVTKVKAHASLTAD